MRLLVTALVVISLVMAVGCDKNDKNTLNPAPKTHAVYPTFHLNIENGFKTFGVDSTQLTVSPAVAWHNAVYTDTNGFVGTLAAGTYIVSIDTTVSEGDTLIDTTSATVGFVPGQEYTFSFGRTEPFAWNDTFRVTYATTYDSSWSVMSVDTEDVVKISPDPNRSPVLVYDSIKVVAPADTIGVHRPPIMQIQPALYGYWLDSAFVIPDFDTASTAAYPPDSLKIKDLIWGYWQKTDSFFLPFDTSYWCDSIGTDTSYKTLVDFYGNPLIVMTVKIEYDTAVCDNLLTASNKRTRYYRTHAWANYDTVPHYAFPDTSKELVFGDTVKIHNLVTDEYKNAVIKVINVLTNDTTTITGLQFREVMPVLEEYKYPDYRIIIEH